MENLVDAGTRELGSSGLTVGPLAFGCWRFTHDHIRDARTALDAALANGMRLIDTADVYGLDWGGAGFGACEALLGRVLSDAPELRDQIVLATKGGIHPPVPYDSGSDGLRRACEASLHRLEVETMAKAGLDGIEAIHRDHPPSQRELFQKWAKELGLCCTAGSDFHGEKVAPDRKFGSVGMDVSEFTALERRRATSPSTTPDQSSAL